jgi:hypothetical protein
MGMNNFPNAPEPTMAQLFTGLVSDAKELLRQELALAKHEISGEFRKTTRGVISLGIGIGIAAVGGLLLILMLVHLLQALTALPLWACYAIVGGLLAIMGVVLLVIGKKRLAHIHMVTQETVETMMENTQWVKEQVTAERISNRVGQR